MQLNIFDGASGTCRRCGRPLSNPESVRAGIGPICSGGHRRLDDAPDEAFADEFLQHMPFSEFGLVVRRGQEGRTYTNIPHYVTHHSPTGFEWGYGGSGPADLALNVLQMALRLGGYNGFNGHECREGTCYTLAWIWHHDFKHDVIAAIDEEGGRVPFGEIVDWMANRARQDEHRLGELCPNYAEVA